MKTLVLPGLIDPHVHLRDPGQTKKEDFYTGTCAALAGGFTTILDMPNNKIPITSSVILNKKILIAQKKIISDVGFYFGSLGDNLNEFARVKDKVFGLKLYLNQTTGNFLIDKKNLENIFKAWTEIIPKKPILVHAEERSVRDIIEIIQKIKHTVHICHISLKSELKQIIKAKKENLPITCGVTPHHLFLTEKDEKVLGPFGRMKPPLATRKDQDFLWKNLSFIDVVESDHAPHTIEEKKSKNPPFGVPGVETTLPLLLTAVSDGRLTIDDVLRLCYKNPAKIFNIKQNKETKIEIDLDKSYFIKNEKLFTKCGWSPFNGWRVKGQIRKVFIRGTKVFENGKILVKSGLGQVVYVS
ncbi:MAG: amidohydrolase family protein [Patescibacteria group bacterium]|nr:amidohydrolase family protein [Patescibacteria group bacterium]